MPVALYTLTSSLHAEIRGDVSEEPFIKEIERALRCRFVFRGEDFSDFGSHETELIYVRTGGTEGKFRSLSLKGNIKLLTSGESNSLAASMEILSYLLKEGGSGEILHGSAEDIAGRIRNFRQDTPRGESTFLKPLPDIDLEGIRLGVIGRPSDWLISSDVDYSRVREKMNAEFIDIPMEELLCELRGMSVDMRGFEGSEAIYSALRTIIGRYSLGGVTVRCFDLLESVHNTGCLALARLNAEGIPAACEGDIPALITMAYLQKSRGCPGFQCNLSRINGDTLLFAHCTAPLSMLDSYGYTTHFESGIGTAIKGDLREEPVEIVKIAPSLDRLAVIPGRIIRNERLKNLCRTQIVVEAPGAADYFLRTPLANHHIVSYLKHDS